MKRKKRAVGMLMGFVLGLAMTVFAPIRADAAGGLTDNPYVETFECPDGTIAWTPVAPIPRSDTQLAMIYEANNTSPYFWYKSLETVTVGERKEMTLKEGQHYYGVLRNDEVDVWLWRVEWRNGRCIHSNNGVDVWHGQDFNNDRPIGAKSCMLAYWSGWIPYCADCGEKINTSLIYTSKDVVSSINRYDTSMPYFYLCPFCVNLENTGELGHKCKQISWNMYKVIYDKNTKSPAVSGKTYDSFHMYNHETMHNGTSVEPVTKLSINGFKRADGYTVVGWNTKPDGSGTFYPLDYEIPKDKSLSSEEYDEATGKGIVKLYAVWVQTESTLHINPNGGVYNGTRESSSIKANFGTNKEIRESEFTAPGGFTVSFDTCGGNTISPIVQTKHFDYLMRENAKTFHGILTEYTNYYKYSFVGDHETEDYVKAIYEADEIILPTPVRRGFHFGGWYKDKDYKELVGFGGDPYFPMKNETLYACWSNLALRSVENYTDNSKKGASDLAWLQEDNTGKFYKVYQSLDGDNFTQLYDATDGLSGSSIDKSFDSAGASETYTIPATGIYKLTAYGAQGSDYGTKSGGKGGKAEGSFFLTKGDVLTISVGSRTGGGAASKNGAIGGGVTTITCNGEVLVVAGGGGGATDSENGGIGGSSEGLRTDYLSAGENASTAGAGGGGGFVGGAASVLDIHTCNEECLNVHHHTDSCYKFTPHVHTTDCDRKTSYYCGAESEYSLVYVRAGLKPEGWCANCGGVCYKDGACIVSTKCCAFQTYECGLEGKMDKELDSSKCKYEEGQVIGCLLGFVDGEVLEKHGAFGGSSYVSDNATGATFSAGDRSGNGLVTIESTSYGYSTELKMDGVASPDLVAPEKIDIESVTVERTGLLQAKVSFAMPADFGTEYFWRVDSYSIATQSHLLTSNVTKTHLITGIAGYRYVYDDRRTHGETYVQGLSSGYGFLNAPEHRNDGGMAVLLPAIVLNVEVNKSTYLHIAPVDVAGNVGGTIDIAIDPEQTTDAFGIGTDKVHVSDVIGGASNGTVYTTGDVSYVRADGVSLFKLEYNSYLADIATKDYQIDYQFLAINEHLPGKAQVFETKVVPAASIIGEQKADMNKAVRKASGEDILSDRGTTGLSRTNQGRQNKFYQCFSVPYEMQGRILYATPMAGITSLDKVVYTNWEDDKTHAAKIIPDGDAPMIVGLEYLAGKASVNRDEPGFPTTFTVMAVDNLSGVKSVKVTVSNQSNGISKSFLPDASGKIEIDMMSDPDLFEGDLVFVAESVDNVGNKRSEKYGSEVFRLTSKIVNASDTTMNKCKRGGGALLVFLTEGYAQEVEISLHDKLKPGNEAIQTRFIYHPTSFAKLDNLVFSIPDSCPDGLYSVTVKATKENGAKVLYDYPDLIVEGTIPVGEIRVRIR